jgi:hypothetical protein
MDARSDRVARNEAMYKAVNREIQEASTEAGSSPTDQLDVLCECGREGCSTTLALTIAEYNETHGQQDRFVVAAGHESPEIERVVKRMEHYFIVDKFGEAEEIAEAEDPR